MRHYDYLIVGAGLFGAVCARRLADAGRSVVVLEERPHIAGNCYTETMEGIVVHVYGPHVFHTSSATVWHYVNAFAQFEPFILRPKVRYGNRLFSFPINLMTLYQIFGCTTPDDARRLLKQVKITRAHTRNLEDWALSHVGRVLYNMFLRGYTAKQWGREPKSLPGSIIARLPIRLDFEDSYFDDRYQGIPVGGYTRLVKRLLAGADVRLGAKFVFGADLPFTYSYCIYTGAIDEAMQYDLGRIEYRGLRFKVDRMEIRDFQGTAVMYYPEESIPWTRVVEHKHFQWKELPYTIVSREFPSSNGRFYPINDWRNMRVYRAYLEKARQMLPNVVFGGRLGEYKYYDMDDTVQAALNLTGRLCRRFDGNRR